MCTPRKKIPFDHQTFADGVSLFDAVVAVCSAIVGLPVAVVEEVCCGGGFGRDGGWERKKKVGDGTGRHGIWERNSRCPDEPKKQP